MLQAISWLQFSSFLFFCLLVYYGYFLHRYYGARWLGALAARLNKMVPMQDEFIEEVDEAVVAADEKGEPDRAQGKSI
jgi:hypothetical protein